MKNENMSKIHFLVGKVSQKTEWVCAFEKGGGSVNTTDGVSKGD